MPVSADRIVERRKALPGRKEPHDPERRGHHLARETLAGRLGFAASTIQKWEKTGLPEGEQYAALAQALGCSLDYLVGLTDIPTPVRELVADEDAVRTLTTPRHRTAPREAGQRQA